MRDDDLLCDECFRPPPPGYGGAAPGLCCPRCDDGGYVTWRRVKQPGTRLHERFKAHIGA